MPKKISVHPHLSPDELKYRYLTARTPEDARRYQLIWQIALGNSIMKAAQLVGYTHSWAWQLLQLYNEQGPDALAIQKTGPKKGTPSKRALLTNEQQAELRKALELPPPDGGEWSGPKVAQWIANAIGRESVRPNQGWLWLKRLGYSLKTSRKVKGVGGPSPDGPRKRGRPSLGIQLADSRDGSSEV